jgi:hypothetical protein
VREERREERAEASVFAPLAMLLVGNQLQYKKLNHLETTIVGEIPCWSYGEKGQMAEHQGARHI